jgi:glutamine synthetase
VAGLLAAVADGLAGETAPPPPVAADIGHWTDEEAAAQGVARLPSRLDTALDALERDEVLLAALGPVIAEHYVAVKRFELDAYLAERGAAPDTTEVTDWERATYLEPV